MHIHGANSYNFGHKWFAWYISTYISKGLRVHVSGTPNDEKSVGLKLGKFGELYCAIFSKLYSPKSCSLVFLNKQNSG